VPFVRRTETGAQARLPRPDCTGSAAQALIVTIKEDLNLRLRVLAKLRAKRPAAIVRTGARLIDRVRLCAFQ
jgi:hypothetical protein